MTQQNKAYAVITGISFGHTDGNNEFGGSASCHYVVIQPDNAVVFGTAGKGATGEFTYGDSEQKIREALAADIRSRESDSNLDVNFVTG